jgi:hypothetical protein
VLAGAFGVFVVALLVRVISDDLGLALLYGSGLAACSWRCGC